eukprot:2133283-Prymnesium_polylepis.1
MAPRSSHAASTRRSKSGIQVSWSHRCLPCQSTLELKATKENAHIKGITSVAFNPVDGKTIVSGSGDQTIKVWDA